ncbi:MAG: preprotein translocase subunit SecE [Desulfoarculaceae bacterium]|nr:preprotein translocase subunit SecE [Desulfoarculaceae bacterium]
MINKSKPVKDLKGSAEESGDFSPAQIKKFINEVRVEASKIVWPERKVTLGLTTVVIVLSTIMAIYLGTVDLLLGKVVSFFLN